MLSKPSYWYSTATMTTERAFYLLIYSSLSAGIVLAASINPALQGFGSEFQLLFIIHLGLLVSSGLLALYTCLKSSPKLAKLFILALLAVICVQGALPITARDALVHHLALPKMWLESGRMVQFKWHEWSYYPFLLQLGYTGLLQAKLSSLTPYYHLLFLIVTAGIVASYAELKSRGAGWIAAAVLLSVPVCIKLGSVPLVDLGLLLYSTCGALLVARWLDRPADWWLPALAGIGFGLSGLVKFNGLLLLGTSLAAIFFLLISTPRSIWFKARGLAFVAGVAVLTLFPYFARNFAWTSNPIYPMFRGFFGSSAPALTASLPPLAHRMAAYGESLPELLLLPIRVFVFGREGDPRLFDGLLSPILLLGIIPLFKLATSTKGERFCSLTSVLYLMVALVSAGARVRYLIPIVGILSATAAPYIARALLTPDNRKKLAAYTILTIHVGYAALASVTMLRDTSTLQHLLSSDSNGAYLERYYPEFSVINWINDNIPNEETTYLLYTGNKFFWFRGSAKSGGYYSGDEIARIIKSSSTATNIFTELKLRGISHLMTHDQRLIKGFKGAT